MCKEGTKASPAKRSQRELKSEIDYRSQQQARPFHGSLIFQGAETILNTFGAFMCFRRW